MKYILAYLLASALTLSAQSNLNALLSQGINQAISWSQPIPAKDQQVVIDKTAALLEKHVTFRPDGTASSYSSISSARQTLQWKNLRIQIITADALNDADRLNGLEKRYRAILTSDAARQWDPKTNAWTPWRTTGHILFPTSITVAWKKGTVTASGGTYLPKFTPGPGPSIQQAKENSPPQKNTPDLPPGMSRGK